MKLRYLEPNSLFNISCVSVLSALWSASDVTELMKNKLFDKPSETSANIIDIEKRVSDNVKNHIPFPSCILSRLANFIEPMREQIETFLKISRKLILRFVKSDLKLKFVWTDRGVLDFTKSAEVIIELNSYDKELCFNLACLFCVENVLVQILPLLPKSTSSHPPSNIILLWLRRDMFNHQAYTEDIFKIFTDFELAFQKMCWSEDFTLSEIFHHFYSIKFLIGIITKDREHLALCLMDYLLCNERKKRLGSVIRFLLLHVSSKKAIPLLKKNAFQVLNALLEWQSLDFFLPAFKHLWSDLTNTEYLHLALEIAECAHGYDVTQDYQNLFFQFWEESPEVFKHHVYLKCSTGSFLSRLLSFNKTDDIFEKIIEGTTAEFRKEIIFHFESMNLCDYLVLKGKLVTLEKFVRSCIPSKEVLSEFLIQFEAFTPSYLDADRAIRKEKFKKIVNLWFE